VSLGQGSSFVIADIPGLIEGASEGHGLGHQFLRHLSRTQLLLHIVDIAPYGEEVDLAQEIRTISDELEKYQEMTGTDLTSLPRWLVVNKTDVLEDAIVQEKVEQLKQELDWQGSIYQISAISRTGTQEVCNDIMKMIQAQQQQALEQENEEKRQAEILHREAMKAMISENNESSS